MDDGFSSFNDIGSPELDINGEYYEPVPNAPAQPKATGLKLVLPSLSKLKAQRQPPKPAKLRPLKEVLTKLITNIKRKDEYAFFLEPVDIAHVPGYLDLIERPMDFGTMATKVQRGRYKTLEDFEDDFRTVTSNAKNFNPPGTIYHSEAQRIETWGLDHIAKAAPTIIQYEAEWNIDIENDDDQKVNMDDDDAFTPVETATPTVREDSPPLSVQFGGPRRSTRAPLYQKKHEPKDKEAKTLSESIDAEGRLPGSKDGLGAFPPGSDWANMMVALKIKGKRYRSKKERLRIEKEGPPYRPDGSLDYQEMENPFTVLSSLVPDDITYRPKLTPLVPSTSSGPSKAPSYDPTTSRGSQTPQPIPVFPAPVNVHLPDLPPIPENPRKHWSIVRNSSSRNKGKDKEDEPPAITRSNRDMHPSDLGSFAALGAQLGKQEGEDDLRDELKFSLDCEREFGDSEDAEEALLGEFWTTRRAASGEEYLRDVVYGGVEGLAYARSVAEFVSTNAPQTNPYLSTWVLNNVINPLTDGRHSLIRQTGTELLKRKRTSNYLKGDMSKKRVKTEDDSVSEQIRFSLNTYPEVEPVIALLKQLYSRQIDLALLIKNPQEFIDTGDVFTPAKSSTDSGQEVTVKIEMSSSDQQAELGRRLRDTGELIESISLSSVKKEDADEGEEESEQLKKLRLDLLVLAKLLPVDKIAKLPKDLVPEALRQFIPTIES